jgi:hypothetical protein
MSTPTYTEEDINRYVDIIIMNASFDLNRRLNEVDSISVECYLPTYRHLEVLEYKLEQRDNYHISHVGTVGLTCNDSDRPHPYTNIIIHVRRDSYYVYRDIRQREERMRNKLKAQS